MYVAVKGGERAIENAHAWLDEERRGDTDVSELSIAQIREQLSLAVNRVMAEGSLYDPDLAALAIKQARGDLIEAIFLVRFRAGRNSHWSSGMFGWAWLNKAVPRILPGASKTTSTLSPSSATSSCRIRSARSVALPRAFFKTMRKSTLRST